MWALVPNVGPASVADGSVAVYSTRKVARILRQADQSIRQVEVRVLPKPKPF